MTLRTCKPFCGRYNLLTRVVDFLPCESRTDSVKSVGGPTMQQIADWLNSLGMSEYAQRFAENRIDFSVLRDLTDQDLKDLGIVRIS